MFIPSRGLKFIGFQRRLFAQRNTTSASLNPYVSVSNQLCNRSDSNAGFTTITEVKDTKWEMGVKSFTQLGTIDALLAQLCVRHELTLLTTDNDFVHAASHCPLQVWKRDPNR